MRLADEPAIAILDDASRETVRASKVMIPDGDDHYAMMFRAIAQTNGEHI